MSYQIKFFHGKSIDELEESINKTLSGCNDEREIVSSDLIYVPEIKEFVFSFYFTFLVKLIVVNF